MGCPPCEATAGPHQETASRTRAPSRDSPPMTMCPRRAPFPAHPVWPACHGRGSPPVRPRLGARSAAAQRAGPAAPPPAAPCTSRGPSSPPLSSAAAKSADRWIRTMAWMEWAPASAAASPVTQAALLRTTPAELRFSRAWSQSSEQSCAGRGLSMRRACDQLLVGCGLMVWGGMTWVTCLCSKWQAWICTQGDWAGFQERR